MSVFLAFLFVACDDDKDDKPVTYTVTFNTDGGEPAVASQSVKQGEKAQQPNDPAKEGFAFSHWITEDGTTYDFSQTINANLSLKAVYGAAISVTKGVVAGAISRYSMSATLKTADGSADAPVTVDKNALNYEPFLARMKDGDTLHIEAKAYRTVSKEGRRLTDDKGNDLLPTLQDLNGNKLNIGDEVLVGEVSGSFARSRLESKEAQTLELVSKASEILVQLRFENFGNSADWLPLLAIYRRPLKLPELLLAQVEYGRWMNDPKFTKKSGESEVSLPAGGAVPYKPGTDGFDPNDRDLSIGLDLKLRSVEGGLTPRRFRGGSLQFYIADVAGSNKRLEAIVTANFEQGEIVDLGVVIMKPAK